MTSPFAIINNVDSLLRDDLETTIRPKSRVSVAAACFSIYAYEELKKQLNAIDELRFIFTSPTFIAEKTSKEKREFFIPRLSRERSLFGNEFEVKLRNELTQRAIARECADWIRRKVTFKSNITTGEIQGQVNVVNDADQVAYSPIKGFTTVDMGCSRGNNLSCQITRLGAPFSEQFIKSFDALWNDNERMENVTEEIIAGIESVYDENAPELIYFFTLYHIFNEFLEDINEDVMPNEATGFRDSAIWKKLYAFQRDAALGIINKLEQYNGCILADSVGLGKTFTALAVIKYYEGRNKNVLVLCPKKLKDNWITYNSNVVNNPLATDRLRYDVLFHTDLSRNSGSSATGLPLDRINWGNYDLVVIDESHNFRNGGDVSDDSEQDNRYTRLMNRVIRAGVKTKVLMLSATPVNNRFIDLRNQLQLAYEGRAEQLNREALGTNSGIDTIFKQAQKAFNAWVKRPVESRTTASLLKDLNFDFFKLLDAVTIARSRKQIQLHYDTSEIGEFPKRTPPLTLSPKLTELEDAASYDDVFNEIEKLNLHLYTPSLYIHPSKLEKYMAEDADGDPQLNRQGRECGIRRLMSINLLKRMESSVHSFRLTIERIIKRINATLDVIEAFEHKQSSDPSASSVLKGLQEISDTDFDDDDLNGDVFTGGGTLDVDLRDMDYLSWKCDIKKDCAIFRRLLQLTGVITPEHDFKLSELKRVITEKIHSPLNEGNRKIIVFTAFADTAEYLYANISPFVREMFDLHTALVTGSTDGKTTLSKPKNSRISFDLNTILTCFSPQSKERDLVMPSSSPGDVDVLIATDCISEGQNLQDCDTCINYDIHWNPVRIIQRFGRIDRIGSKNKFIRLVNFWPDISLDNYINLKARVEARMRISVMTSTGDDDYINAAEKGDLDYRRKQLERLQNEVVDLEEMNDGISIMDLGLNDYRMDLLSFMKENPGLERTPPGIHAVVRGKKPGVLFVLKNVSGDVNIENQNRLHPFYLVFAGEDGSIICNHLQPKDSLSEMRALARGKHEPDRDACREFNDETNDGRKMTHVSELLQDAIASIVSVNDESDVDSLFKPGGTTALLSDIKGLDNFELICFLVVKEEK